MFSQSSEAAAGFKESNQNLIKIDNIPYNIFE